MNIAICGNGKLTSDETCDDGNTDERRRLRGRLRARWRPGFQCRVPGKPCTPKCGDGIISGAETCDDGNTDSGDGCSATCQLEIGWKCSGTPSKCTKTTCGDGKNAKAPRAATTATACPSTAAPIDCQNRAGLQERRGVQLAVRRRHRARRGCDDGNAGSGDGCSKDCKIEPGWTCTQPPIGDKMMVPVIYRDFKFSKDVTGGNDFETGVTGSYNPTTGIVNAEPRRQGQARVYRRRLPAPHTSRARTRFSQWYTRRLRHQSRDARPS